MRNSRSANSSRIDSLHIPNRAAINSRDQCERSSQHLSKKARTDAPKYLDAERSLPSSQSNIEVIDSSENILSPISNLLNDRNMQRPQFSEPCHTSRRSESSNPTENTVICTAESTTRPKKEFHSLEKNKNRSSNLSPPSPSPPPRDPNSTAPSPAEPNSDPASQTPSEHSSGSDAAFYCSVGSSSEDEEDGSGASLALREKEEGEGDSGLAKRTLQETVPTSGTDGGGKGEDDEEEEEEENKIHNKNNKRRKLKKRYTFFKRIFGRKKARDSDGDAGGIT
ncbi:hypothetical protein BHYA_0121g00090 [Botrytis hyacinthi]|uniref:Uncharacterized protein n=1 Tax=Botrytis hyacinthi TaxID=278943 RepID=A0A4Z1GK03_9HELO|nr:hypothetical protein BHYA_0121g00090 [Botrytis hyacinthi]